MRLSHFFIDRPVFAAVIAIIIVLVGAIAYPSLPVAQYPNIVPPTVTVSATYPGATAETLADTVSNPIEEQINGVEDMIYMSSQSTADGHVTITVTFKLGTDPNTAQVLVENRVAAATAQLPPEVVQQGVIIRKSSPDILLAIHMYSPDASLDQQYIANYEGLHIKDEILRQPGVGDVSIRAARDYSMRIWIDPERAAQRQLTVEDIVTALSGHNIQVAGGSVGQPPFDAGRGAYQLNVEALGRLTTPEQFGQIIVKTDAQGRSTRISDVARVELGAADYTTDAFLSLQPAVAIGVLAQPGSNAIKTAAAIKATMLRLKRSFPPGLDYKIIYNPTDFVQASIVEVQKTLVIAIVLVVIVVMVFLQSWRAAVIPIVAIPVSLVGTLAVMAALGFSLNNLSLFGLVLAIGIVVDDAIVVVENIERHLREGTDSRAAAHLTMEEVGGALIAIALVLTAVFVPTGFLTGISGQFYRQFALTIASATLISLVVSLTLSPAMAALIMKPHSHGRTSGNWRRRPLARFGEVFNDAFNKVSDRYSRLIHRLVNMTGLVLTTYLILLAITGWRLAATPQGFIPDQDQGNLLISATLPPGAALARTDVVMKDIMARLLDTPGVVAGSVYAGVDATTSSTSSNNGQIYVILEPFQTRLAKGLTLERIKAEIEQRVASITAADVRVIEPPPVRGIGTTGGFKLIVESQSSNDPTQLEAVANRVATEANKSPVIDRAFVTFNTRNPALYADIDRTKAEMLGVKDSAVFDTLQTYLGSTFVNQFNLFGRTFDVFAQADAPFRTDESKIALLKTRSASGTMVPLGSVLTLRHVTEPYRVLRYNLYPSAEVLGAAKSGFSTGQAMEAMEKAAAKVLPPGYSYEWTEIALQQKLAGDTGVFIFAASVLFVFLMLAALYESVTLPFAVILIVPMCILAAITGVNLRGLDDNILTQVGLVVLIGLAAKNAILIVEFARQGEEEHGLERHEAAAEAGRTRLRPILMTSFAFIFGVIPLAFASGAGAEMRVALGTAVLFGMLGVTAFGLIFTPVFYVVFRIVSERLPRAPRPPRPPRPRSADAAPIAAPSEPLA